MNPTKSQTCGTSQGGQVNNDIGIQFLVRVRQRISENESTFCIRVTHLNRGATKVCDDIAWTHGTSADGIFRNCEQADHFHVRLKLSNCLHRRQHGS